MLNSEIGIVTSVVAEITHATRKDLDRLIEIFAGADLKTNHEESVWFVNCYFGYNHIIVAKVDKEIQGACFWRIEGEKYSGLGWIENLWVEEQHRRKGLGEELLRKSIDDMRVFFERYAVKLRKVILTTQTERKAARQLYERIGFVAVAGLGDIYDLGGHDLFYVLDAQR